jgi:lysophospholipase L1-like esterase
MKTVFCYGDSNTWGFDPHTLGRYDHKTRWPMVLGQFLNEGCDPGDPAWWVVEEGLSGRTSCREDPVEGDKNGLRQLLPILESHKPVDAAVVMLGTNDLKPRFSPLPYDIALGAAKVALAIRDSRMGPGDSSPQVILICPPATVESPVFKHIFGDSVELSKKLPPLYRRLAEEYGVHYLEAGKFIKSSAADGIHLDPEGHLKLAQAVAELIKVCP